MEYLLIIILLLVAIIVYGFLKRKKIYAEVDRLESWKLRILNEPVTDEIAKVKQLNMTGQTEEKFESWRVTWDEIVTNELPAIDDLLFEAEEAADRYRFKKANQINRQIRSILEEIEKKIANILEELQELIGSEEKNKVEIEELKGLLKEQRKILLVSRHSFGSAIIQLEKNLEDIVDMFHQFDEATKGGNYLEAREIVLKIRSELENIAWKIDEIPKLLSYCHQQLPSQIQDLKNGKEEMIQAGYMIDHLEIDKELEKIEGEIITYLRKIEQNDIAEAKEGIADIQERIEQIYDCLEKEAIAKQIVTKETPMLQPLINEIEDQAEQAKMESESVQQIYHLKDKDLEDQRKIEKKVAQTVAKYEDLLRRIEENMEPATKLREEMEEIKGNIKSINELYIQFSEMMHTLRKDEREAKEKIAQMKKILVEARALIRKNHLPGLPVNLLKAFETAEANLKAVSYKLEETPLDMYAVNNLLEEAQNAVNKVHEQTVEMVEKAMLVEQIIQYGNRYRSKNPVLAAQLLEAEQIFRMYDYDLALEQAATALEEVEPGALKKVEELMKSRSI
ncbi:septation ring formation regulator EzrA [Calidifontibacillus erzurumensis]|uniref:Septation ring formation regulator EzrA n=1 Tax=Calidifontibacillus erzurumensis TaxID=2741433 RepID=A0A8J8KAX2_9BACI|nr:septation ring formation regulator EzrA [Calidifontibacillus erzurumensis]NSL51309.1 septation ring formation regulator EzrA [Calidifontibacillus erzurumensis]